MKTRRELLAEAERAWPRFLRSVVTGESFFPLAVRIGKTRLAADYGARKAELEAFRRDAESLGLTVAWRETDHRRYHTHEVPNSAVWESELAYIQALGKAAEVRAFRDDVAMLPPTFHEWAAGSPLTLVEHHGAWPELLRVVEWFRTNPRSGLYLRQIPVEGVDTKFFEQRLKVLDALLVASEPTARHFEHRHGLRREEPLIRLRFLDTAFQMERGFPIADFALPAPAFRTLALAGANVVVTENLRNFLALPFVKSGVAVFGGGNAIPLLAGAAWLSESRIHYWGDMDQHGFAILGQMRTIFPNTQSLLMDAASLAEWRKLAGADPTPMLGVSTAALTLEERVALKQITDNRLRLEQERIPFPAVLAALRAVTAVN